MIDNNCTFFNEKDTDTITIMDIITITIMDTAMDGVKNFK